MSQEVPLRRSLASALLVLRIQRRLNQMDRRRGRPRNADASVAATGAAPLSNKAMARVPTHASHAG